ncbi:hypothetical protein AVMA1855_06075 [Acidovorax sp. SUPP1855]|uniref:NTF2 fold immunity protein n=1 Tax=Acidovorax sp. SUPP1855 TaxID=431774 RepID=UPI0023DE6039|nr:NTF2 fold immunity protein [Acidovorax sp. SUPP1855]GKS83689.1 hypothetical protein AVMA1855_06075 [Acidovorax sp. SUPP1855]
MTPEQTINAYLSELLKWETEHYSKIRTTEYRNNLENEQLLEDGRARGVLEGIINCFLTKKAILALGQSALITMRVGHPPVYDQSIIDTKEEGRKSYVICKSNNGALLGSVIRYTLLQEGSSWKIDQIHASRDQITWRKNNSI